MENQQERNVFAELSKINVNDKTEDKDGLTYLSWAWAWSEVKKRFADADYSIRKFGDNQVPFQFVPGMGYMVWTSVTILGDTKEMWLPVMDSANKPMLDSPYSWRSKNKNFRYAKQGKDGKYYDKYGNEQKEYIEHICLAATMFDVNKTIMRCLVKNLAMHGLGIYIYAGEDLPETEDLPEEETKKAEEEPKKIKCEDCGAELVAIGKNSAEALGIYTRKKYGRCLCAKCAEKEAKFVKTSKEAHEQEETKKETAKQEKPSSFADRVRQREGQQ